MNLDILKRVGGPAFQKALLRSSKYAPEILTGVGIVGVIGGTVLVARAATRLEPIINAHELAVANNKSDGLLLAESRENNEEDLGYTEEEVKKELVKIYGRTALKLTKEFAPGITLQAFSIVSILAAHGIMQRRTVALLGAYKAVETAFAEYRDRVISEVGEEKEKEIRYGVRTETVEDSNGKKTKRKVWDPASFYSPYAKVFDEGNINYRDTPEYNHLFLKNQQQWANDLLQIQGYLFLSDVYKSIGIDETPQSRVVGWVLGDKHSDNQIDFGIYNTDSERARDFINGLEKSIILDFNVDGVILDHFSKSDDH